MTISMEDYERLERAGFLEFEILGLANATDAAGNPQPPIDLGSPAWQVLLKSRKDWIDDKIERGWEKDEYTREIRAYYERDKKRTPFDWLKEEYKPKKKKADYLEARRRREIEQIKKL